VRIISKKYLSSLKKHYESGTGYIGGACSAIPSSDQVARVNFIIDKPPGAHIGEITVSFRHPIVDFHNIKTWISPKDPY